MLLELERAWELLENTIKMQILTQQFVARARESAFLMWRLPPDDSAAGWEPHLLAAEVISCSVLSQHLHNLFSGVFYLFK